MHIPRPHPALFPAVRELVNELPSGATIWDIADELETLGCSIFSHEIPGEIAELMREKINDFISAIREFKSEEKEKEREAAQQELARVFDSLMNRDQEARTALLIALDPLCIRGGAERISLRGELAPQFSSLPSSEITESLLRFGTRSQLVQIAAELRRDILKIKSSGMSISLKRIDLFISKFNPPSTSSGGEKEETQHGLSISENEQSV